MERQLQSMMCNQTPPLHCSEHHRCTLSAVPFEQATRKRTARETELSGIQPSPLYALNMLDDAVSIRKPNKVEIVYTYILARPAMVYFGRTSTAKKNENYRPSINGI